MLNSAIIEVIIGLIFVFSLCSIIVTQVNTVITNIFNTRARHLKAGLDDMITDPVVRVKLLAHPLIRLIPPEIQPEDQISAQSADITATTAEPRRVSSVPPELFSQALLDILSANAAIDLYAPLEQTIEANLNGAEKAQMREMLRRMQGSGIGVMEFRNAIASLADARDRAAMMTALTRVEQMRADMQANNEKSRLIPLLEGIRFIGDASFRKALDTLLASAQSLDEAKSKIEFWYNARMEQLTEQYRRRISFLSLIVGLSLTVTFNIDSLYLARSLWDDPALRAAVALAAQEAINNGQLQQQIQQQQEAITAPVEDPNAIEIDASAQSSFMFPDFVEDVADVNDTVFTLLNLRLPVGWDYVPIESGCPQADLLPDPCAELRNLWNFLPGNNTQWFNHVIIKLLGWSITIVAIAQGAPFWFDLLNRITRRNQS